MIITCPYCGPRDVGEFTYQGDATVVRPDPASTDQEAWNAYVYDRTNPAGRHSEYWQHSGGCRAHLVVERDTVTHAVGAVRFARGKTAKPAIVRKKTSASKAGAARKPQPARRAPARKPVLRKGTGK